MIGGCFVLLTLAKALWGIHSALIPLRHKVIEAKENLEGMQLRALNLADALVSDISSFQSYEGSLLNRYLDMIGSGAEAGVEGNRIIAMMQRIAPPSTQSAALYQSKMSEMSQLGREFQQKLEAYNAAVAALNTRKEIFPANLFSNGFFGIPNAIYLSGADRQLLPPTLISTHIEHTRQLTILPPKGNRPGNTSR